MSRPVNQIRNAVKRAEARGVPVIWVPGWETRGRDGLQVQSSVVHHTAGASTGDYPSLKVVCDGRAGLSGPLCNFGTGRSGTIYVVAAGIANHAGVVSSTQYQNSHSLGNEMENTGTGQPWPDVQLRNAAILHAELAREFGYPVDRTQGHKEVCFPKGRKIDPAGFSMDWFRNQIQNYYDEDDFMSALNDNEQRELLDAVRAIRHESTVRLPNRTGDPTAKGVDTVLGYAANSDGYGYRIERLVNRLLGFLTDPIQSLVPGSKNKLSRLQMIDNIDARTFTEFDALRKENAALKADIAALNKKLDASIVKAL